MVSFDSYYLPVGFSVLLVLLALVLVTQFLPLSSPSAGFVSLGIRSNSANYSAVVSEDTLFSSQPTEVLFSSRSPGEAAGMRCFVNCIKID